MCAKRKAKRKSKFYGQLSGLIVTKPVVKVLKHIHPQTTISTHSMTIVHDFLADMFEKLAETAGHLLHKVGCKTLMAHDITAAVSLEMHGELKIFAMTRGLQALTLVADSYGLDTRDVQKAKYINAKKDATL